jgi:hypothetical protein
LKQIDSALRENVPRVEQFLQSVGHFDLPLKRNHLAEGLRDQSACPDALTKSGFDPRCDCIDARRAKRIRGESDSDMAAMR